MIQLVFGSTILFVVNQFAMSKLTTTISFQMGCMFAIAMLSYTNGKVDKYQKLL